MKDGDHDPSQLTEEPADGGGEINGASIAVPDGEYELRYLNYETGSYFGNPKLILHCAIVNSDDYGGTPVDRFYNVQELIDRPRMYGRYKAIARGALVREYQRLFKAPERLDRISFTPLKEKRLMGRLEKVTHSYDQKILAPEHQYSRIAELIEILPDEDWGS